MTRWERWRRAFGSQRGAGVAWLCGAALMALLAAGALDQEAHVGPDAPTARATVVYQGGKVIVVEFTTLDGRTVQAETQEFPAPPPGVGERVLVRYGPQDPQAYVRVDGAMSDIPAVVWLAGCAALFAALGVAGLRGRLPDWLLNR